MNTFNDADKLRGGESLLREIISLLATIKKHEANREQSTDPKIADPKTWIDSAITYIGKTATWQNPLGILAAINPNDLYKSHLEIEGQSKSLNLNNKPSKIDYLLELIADNTGDTIVDAANYKLTQGKPIPISIADANVSLRLSGLEPDPETAFWDAIVNRTNAIGFESYVDFITLFWGANNTQPLFDGTEYNPATSDKSDKTRNLDKFGSLFNDRNHLNSRNIYGIDAYQLLKQATQAFLTLEAGVVINNPRERDGSVKPDSKSGGELDRYLVDKMLPFFKGLPAIKEWLGKSEATPFAEGLLRYRYSAPSMMELIYCYWMEQGMLAQTMNAIALRYQNYSLGPNQVLKNFAVSPLKPLSNLLWGYIQDENNRLTLARRAAEYMSQYGLQIEGKAVPRFDNVDSRPRFLGALHSLLHNTLAFYKEDANTTIVADGFGLLNALREVHMILSDGAVNQFGDLTCAAREEMLIMQWLLSRQEMREFLRGRPGTPYKEDWMEQVEAMKRLQGWPDISIIHFHDLAQFGEQLLLSIRYSNWMSVTDQNSAKRWARKWRAQVQGYTHAYQAVTGVNLAAADPDTRKDLQPSLLLKQRMPNVGRETTPEALSWEPPQQNEYGRIPYGYTGQRALPVRRQ